MSAERYADLRTGWRNNGHNGYAWIFVTRRLSIFRFRASRAATGAHEIFGLRPLPGPLVVDRYNAYNKLPCKLQYCYAHLLREVERLEKEFPEHPEIQTFVATFAPLLSAAMRLRTLKLSARQFRRQARRIAQDIRAAVNTPAVHPGIQKIQDVFREKDYRLFHWARDAAIPADNNRAERELRPLVIARKISFGSQSDAGAHTREILMTVLHSLKKRVPNVEVAFKEALDRFAINPKLDIYQVLFGSDSS